MLIFGNTHGKLSEISEVPFKLEKDLQALVEDNIKSVFGIDLVKRELEVGNRRFDTLGFDKESNSFVIIEYKRGKDSSVVDQGYGYLSLLLGHKAESVLAYNKKFSKNKAKADFDWSQSRVIFVSPSFTLTQRQAIGFKGMPIELWEVKQYSNKTVLFNRIESAIKGESITALRNNPVVQSVSKEVKAYDEEFHLKNASDEIKEVYMELKESILAISPDITMRPKKKYISFLRKVNFVDVTILRSTIKLWVNMKKGKMNDPKGMARDVSNIGHWGKGDYEVKIKDNSDMGYVMYLIKQYFDKN